MNTVQFPRLIAGLRAAMHDQPDNYKQAKRILMSMKESEVIDFIIQNSTDEQLIEMAASYQPAKESHAGRQ